MHSVLDADDVPGDRSEIRMLRRLQFAMALGSMPAITLIGVMLAARGHTAPSIWPFAYVAATAILIATMIATRKFSVIRIPHTLLVGIVPIGLTLHLGGFAQGGGAMLWTLLIPITATMFGLPRRAAWFGGAVIAAIVVLVAHRPEAGVLSSREIEVHFAFNIIGFTGFLFTSVSHFVSRLDQEKARADGLLLRVLPAPIVRRLKRNQGVIADHVPGVTVVFADIAGFTPLAARLHPNEVVELLDEIFTAFDALTHRFGVEKIKTIGDAYMAVAGVPEPCTDHAARSARLAFGIRDFVADFARRRNVEISMRIGLHTGEVVAGVIGIERFSYDLWGDTVNTASRMESHGAPGQVQITRATRDALGSAFTTVERGPIEVKGRGTIVTYWLLAEGAGLP